MKTDLQQTAAGNLSRRYLAPMQEILIACSIVIFSIAGTMKLLSAVLLRLGVLDRVLAAALPASLNYTAGVVELGVVYCLVTNHIPPARKLQILMLVGIALVSFRLMAFGSLFPPDCGCFGPITTLHGNLGRAFEFVSGLFLCVLPLGYIGETLRNGSSPESRSSQRAYP